MANYPNSLYSHSTVVDGSNYPLATHINTPAAEIVAIETELGTNPRSIDDTVSPSATPASVAAYLDMLANIVKTMSGTSNWYSAAIAIGSYISTCDFRLTLTSGTPITTSDVTGATNIYISPFRGNRIALYNGTSAWNIRTASEITVALGTLTSGLPYDIFVYDNAGTVTARAPVAWTNATTRATALTTQNGVLVKSGATTDRYLGTFYTTSTTTTEDSAAKRHLYNYYNRVDRLLNAKDTTDSWTYTTQTWRAANNNTTVGQGRVEVTIGWSEDLLEARYLVPSSTTVNANAAAGIGIDSTSANSALVYGEAGLNATTVLMADYLGYPGVGYHYIQSLEIAVASGTRTWYGDNGVTYIQSGLIGKVLA